MPATPCPQYPPPDRLIVDDGIFLRRSINSPASKLDGFGRHVFLHPFSKPDVELFHHFRIFRSNIRQLIRIAIKIKKLLLSCPQVEDQLITNIPHGPHGDGNIFLRVDVWICRCRSASGKLGSPAKSRMVGAVSTFEPRASITRPCGTPGPATMRGICKSES